MFVHNIDPVLFSIGPFSARYYGLAYVIGFLCTYYILYKKRNELGITKDSVERLLIYIVLGTIIGARLFEVFVWEPAYYLSEPLRMLQIWKGGMSLHGGLLGVIFVSYIFARRRKISPGKLADVLVIPALVGMVLGRIANFINGELVGTISNLPWCVVFPGYEGCRHPVQLYGAAGRLLLLGYLLYLPKLKKWKDGFIFWNFILLLGIGRFFCDFLREDMRYWGLSTGQYLSIAMAAAAAYVLVRYYASNSIKSG